MYIILTKSRNQTHPPPLHFYFEIYFWKLVQNLWVRDWIFGNFFATYFSAHLKNFNNWNFFFNCRDPSDNQD